MIGFTHYASIYNNYCLAYFGLVPEYIVQLRMIRALFKGQFPELCVFIACLDEFVFMLDKEPNVIPYSQMKDSKYKLAHIYEIATSMENPHSMLKLVQEAIPNLVIENKLRTIKAKHCLVCPDGALPTKPYHNVNRLKQYAESAGYYVKIVGSDIHPSTIQADVKPSGLEKMLIVSKADWVIGVENEYLFEAIRIGIRTTLVPTGLGTNLYKFFSPNSEILN